jgi:hypothetical protein
MHPDHFGDSYDIVKRFFCQELRAAGYEVFADPMFADGAEIPATAYHRLLGAAPVRRRVSRGSALFLDPGTGVRQRGGRRHISFDRLAEEAKRYALVFAFDQSFSRGESDSTVMRKLRPIAELGCCAMYYSSHAHFVFVARRAATIRRLRLRLMQSGLPESRLVVELKDLSDSR